MLKRFYGDKSGNVAIITGLTLIPLLLAVGLGVDYARHSSAQKHLQEMADATSLALAASREKDQGKLELLAADFLTGNQNLSRVQQMRLVELKAGEDDVDVEVAGSIPATFMALAGYERLNVRASALAERAVNGQVEVALVLDNTDSMAIVQSGGTRIAALKTAANKLIDELLRDNDGSVRIGLVPYGEYVNVGTTHRGASWLSVAADYSESKPVGGRKAECRMEVVERRNTNWVPARDCSYSRDGTWIEKTCPGYWQTEPVRWEERCYDEVPPRQQVTHYKWHGCVGSRTGTHPGLGENRLHDGNPGVRYVGLVEEHQRCLTEIVPLTSNRSNLRAAINGMVTSRPGHVPLTYIPAGMVWGLNVLSPTEPFAQGAAYDPLNQGPRKVAVLMTDGFNTLRYEDGLHHKFTLRKDNENNANVITTNDDTLAICENMKERGIEIFTVAFMVDSPRAKAMLEACSTDPASHYFDASDSDELLAAFEGIGQSLRIVRLAR